MLLLEHTCDIKRSQDTGTNGKTVLTTIASDVASMFLPMEPTMAVSNGYSIGQAYTVFFDGTVDVRDGDKLLKGGRNYSVNGVRVFDTAIGAHLEVAAKLEAS